MTLQRVAVTGMGAISSLGVTAAELLANVAIGRSGIRPLAPHLCGQLLSPIGAPIDFDGSGFFAPARLKLLDRGSQLALVAVAEAVQHAGLDFARERTERCGVFVGSRMGGAQTTDEGYQAPYAQPSDRIKPYSVLTAMTNAPAAWIGIDYHSAGPNLTYSTACSSSADSRALAPTGLGLRLGSNGAESNSENPSLIRCNLVS